MEKTKVFELMREAENITHFNPRYIQETINDWLERHNRSAPIKIISTSTCPIQKDGSTDKILVLVFYE